MRYLFEEHALDTDRRELRRGAELIPTAPQVFDLLSYLICNRERVVSKDDLISAVWNGRIVSDAALTTRINAARSAIGDTGERQRLIKTVARKGFRFVATVQEACEPTNAFVRLLAQNGATAPTPPSLSRRSIVVLPFANLSRDPSQDYFVDGVTESLTTDLSRISGSFVISRHTAFAYKGKTTDLKQIGRELDVRYVLEGSVQRGGNRLRVNVQLIDAESGSYLWADRFDKAIADLFDMQDEIVTRIARALHVQLIEAEARRAERALNPDAVDFYFRGRHAWNKGVTLEYLAEARRSLEQALAIDPKNVDAMMWAAAVDVVLGCSFLTDHEREHLAAAEARALEVLSLAPDDAMAHLVFASVLMHTGRAAQGIAECERALALDRNLADAHALMGIANFFAGRGADTEACVKEALRLSPHDISAFRWLMMVGFSKIQMTADAEAAIWFARGIEANRNYPLAHFGQAAALALLGRLDEAQAAASAGLGLDPGFTIRRFKSLPMLGNARFVAGARRTVKGMHIAGVPEE